MFTSVLICAKMKMEGVWRDMKKYLCEFLGTCVLVLFGCGVAVLSGADLIATSLAFGLSIVAIAYTIGKVSGCHVNPAVSFAMWIDKRISTKTLIGYIIAQVLGAVVASGLLYLIFNSTTLIGVETLGANAYGDLVGSDITMLGALITEIILTFVFVLAVLGVTRDEKHSNIAPIVIGLALVLVHLFGINLTGTSVNPARSIGPALFAGGEYLSQLVIFIIGPIVGAAFAALAIFFIDLEETDEDPEYRPVVKKEDKVVVIEEKVEKEIVKAPTKRGRKKVENKETQNSTKKVSTARKPKIAKTTNKKETEELV